MNAIIRQYDACVDALHDSDMYFGRHRLPNYREHWRILEEIQGERDVAKAKRNWDQDFERSELADHRQHLFGRKLY